MSSAHVDRNLLFGILALQMDFISRDSLVAAMHAWVLQKSKPLGQILVEQGVLAPKARSALDALVEQHLELHQGDPQQSLVAVGLPGAMRSVEAQFADPDVKASLLRLATMAPVKPTEQTTLPMSEKTPTDARFEILRSHAWGGLGEVFVAQDREVNREVALKRLHERYADNVDSRARFLREAEITGGLEHPGIVPVYGLGISENGRPYYAMRFIRGQTLKEAIDRFHSEGARPQSDRRIELRQLLGRFIAVCNAIEYAHSRGILHRDLKPSNIMLGKYGETLVVDWGLCKALGRREPESAGDEQTLLPSSGSGSSETLPGSAIGTPAYMSPEQSEGRIENLGPASDVYSLGATLYTILTGKEPFESTVLGMLLGKVQTGDFAPPRERNPSVPRALDAICLKAMNLLPKDRYPSCAELASDIEHWLADEPVTAFKDPLSDRTVRWIKQHRVLAASSTALLATAFVGLVVGTGLLSRANSRIAAEASRATSNEVAAVVANEQTQDTLTSSLFEQARAVRLSGLPSRRWHALELLKQAEQLRAREHSNLPSQPAGTAHSPATRDIPRKSQLRSEAVAALLVDDAHVVAQWGGLCHAVTADGTLAANLRMGLEHNKIGLAIIDLKTRQQISQWEGSDAMGMAIALGPNGKTVATVMPPMPVSKSKSSRGGIHVWDLPTRKLLRELSLSKQEGEASRTEGPSAKSPAVAMPFLSQEMILAARFSPDGRWVYALTGSVAGCRFVVWDLKGDAAGHELGQASVQGLTSNPFSPDGRLLAFASSGKKVVLWSIAGNRVEKTIELPLEPSGAIGIAPDGGLGIVAALTDEKAAGQSVGPKTLLIWDVAKNRQLQRIDSIPSDATGVSFAPGGTRVAISSGRDGSILVVDLTGRKPAVRLNDRMITQLLAWTDDRHLLSGGIGSLKAWEFAEESPLSDLRLEGAPGKGFDGPLEYSPNGRVLAVEALGRPHVDLFDPTTGKLLRRLDPSDKVPPLRLSFSPDGKQIVRLGDQSAVAWDVETGTQRCRLDAKLSHARSFGSVGFCADGRILVGESDDTKPAVAEMAAGKVIWRGSRESPFNALVSRDGRFATTVTVNTTEKQESVPLFDLSTGRELYQLPGAPKSLMQTLCEFSPDARWLLTLHLGTAAAAGLGGDVPVGDEAARVLTSEMADQPWNGEIWDVPSRTRHMQITGLSDPVAYAFSHDGRYLAVGMANGVIRFWDTQGREELFDWFPFADQSQESHASRYLTFTAEGATLVIPSPVSQSLRTLNLIRVNEQLGSAALNW